MKILFLSPWYPSESQRNHGIFVQQQALAVSQIHEVEVISSKIDYSTFGFFSYRVAEIRNANVNEHTLVIKRSFPIYNQINYFIISALVSIKIARKFKPDIIHGNIGYPGGFWAWLVSKIIRRPYVFTEHNSFFENHFRSRVQKALTIFPLKRAHTLITVGEKSKMSIEHFVKRPVEIVPNIVMVTNFQIAPFPSTPVRIGFLGGLSSSNHAKGLDVLIRCLGKIKQEFVLHVGGDGTMLTFYKKLASEILPEGAVVFHGFIAPNKVPQFMNNLHFFVNCSKHESFGIAIAEALASGVPVVGFKNGGSENFVGSDSVVLIEDQDEQGLVEGIQRMIDNYSDFDRGEARNFIVEKFSEGAFVDKMDLIYRKVTAY
jgi:glycosyltransferase involved in cell wall biosynthesis